jgi:ribokinase
MPKGCVAILGSFVADLAFRAKQLPHWGETILGSEFRSGPGGKGSNQAVAAARLGAHVSFISLLGQDSFGDLARQTYAQEGIDTQFLFTSPRHATGGASIIVDENTGQNAIVVVPGAGMQITCDHVERARPLIEGASLFMTQLETPLPAVTYGLKIAKAAGVTTILNPAPAQPLPDSVFPLCDYLTPNEAEAAALAGHVIRSIDDAQRAADVLLSRGAANIVITLGAAGALVKNHSSAQVVSAFNAGTVIETTGAGDAFNGALAVGLSEGLDVLAATRFGCAAAGISVTRYGTAPSMPTRSEVEKLLLARQEAAPAK